jgi:LacI family transcriptional regulator
MPRKRRAPSSARPVTLWSIARRCRVAKSTVSLALRGDPRVQPKTAARIRTVAGKLGYNADQHESARRLALRKYGTRALSKVIGFLCPEQGYTFPFYARILQGVLEGFSPAGLNVVAGSFVRKPSGEIDPTTSLEHLLSRGDLDALIYYSDERTFAPVLQRVRMNPGFQDRPVLSLLFAATGCSCVLTDEEDGACRAAGHLLDLGHRNLLLLGTQYTPQEGPLAPARWAGVRRAFGSLGLNAERHLRFLAATRKWVDPIALPHALHEIGTTQADENGSSTALLEFLRAHREITAIVAQNDSMALRAWHTLYQADLRVPADMSIVGFDDTDPMLDESGRNLLTTVRLPLLEAGREAARLLTRRVTGELDHDETVRLATEFVARSSTAAPRKERI